MIYKKWLDKNIPSLEGKIYIVTGSNAGIGKETIEGLLYKKASVIMACRNVTKARIVKDELLEKYPSSNVHIEEFNQASIESIKLFSLKIKNNYSHIDGIVLNAGVYFPKKDYKTKDGYELTIGTNYIGNYILINELKSYLNECKAHVVLVSSLVSKHAKHISLKEAFLLKRNPLYNYSKWCVGRLYSDLVKEKNEIIYSLVHPGICSTNIISSEQTGFPNWFSILGHKILTLFTHSASKACLVNILGLVNEDSTHPYIVPKGLFNISGYPVKKKVPAFMDYPIIEETKKLLRED